MQQRITFRQVCLVTLFSGLLLSGDSACAREQKSITIVTEGGYEPWNLALPGGKLNGFEPELMADLYQWMQIEYKLVIQNWDGMIARLSARKYGMIVDAIVVTPERSKVVAFTQACTATPTSFIMVKGSLLPPSPAVKLRDGKKEVQTAIAPLRAALKGKTIGIASGTVYTPFIDKYFRDIADIRKYNDSANTILNLQAECVDTVFNDITFANATLSRPENSNLALSGSLMSGPIWGGGKTMGVRFIDTDLRARLDSTIQAALTDGTVRKLSEK